MAEPTLKRGSEGSAVTDLQEALRQLGFDPGGIDGIFGPGTPIPACAKQVLSAIRKTHAGA